MKILSPDEIIAQLQDLVEAGSKIPDLIYDAECKVADCEFEYDRIFQSEILKNQGTVSNRTALATLAAAEARLAADLARAELNRLKNHAKRIADNGILVATMSKNVELTYRHA